MNWRLAPIVSCVVLSHALIPPPASIAAPLPDVVRAEARQVSPTAGRAADVPSLGTGTWEGDVFVLPFTAGLSYDRYQDGLSNLDARRWVVLSVPEAVRTRYDFFVVFTNFPVDLGTDIEGLYWEVRNDTLGIGIPQLDISSQFDSPRLQGVIDANSIATYLREDGTLDEAEVLKVLNHELGHRWLARCRFADGGGASSALLGVDGMHWSYLLDSDASFMYGADWRPNGDGTFTAHEVLRRFSPLDLYLMGLLAPEEVAPFSLLVNPQVPADQPPTAGATVTATSQTVTVDQVIAAEGPRQPAWNEGSHELRVGLVFLVDPANPVDPSHLPLLQGIRSSWQRSFFVQTRGKGVIDVGLAGAAPGSGTVVDLQAGAGWLAGMASASGTWQDSATTTLRDSIEAVTALTHFPQHDGVVQQAVPLVAALDSPAIELRARKARFLLQRDLSEGPSLVDELVTMTTPEGGWRALDGYGADAVTTSRALPAMVLGGRTTEAETGWSWLFQTQNADGGWGWRPGSPSAVVPTLEVLLAARETRADATGAGWFQQALVFLLGYLGADGGLGDPFGDIPETAAFLLAVEGGVVDQARVTAAAEFLAQHQQADGSWEGSTYKTAVALQALIPLVLPDPSVQSSELWVEPSPAYDGDALHVLAAVRNTGYALPAGLAWRLEIRGAAGQVLASQDGVLPAIESYGYTTVEVIGWQPTVPVGTHSLALVLDPLGQSADRDRANNTAVVPLVVKAHSVEPDPALLAGEVAADPSAIVAVPLAVTVGGQAHNFGQTAAPGVPIRVFAGDPQQNIVLGSGTLDLPALGAAPFQISVSITQAQALTLTVVIDPDGTTGDPDPGNNRVEIALTVQEVVDVAIPPGAFSATPTSLDVGSPVVLAATVHNIGTVPVTGLLVGYTYSEGDPPQSYPIALVPVDGTLAPGESREVQTTWRPNVSGSALQVSAIADPQDYLADADRSDNAASLTLNVQPSPLPNLSAVSGDVTVTPAQPEQDQTAHVSAVIRNLGNFPSGPFVAEIRMDDAASGAIVTSLSVPELASGATVVIEGDVTPDQPQDRLLWVVADVGGSVAEYNEVDNTAFKVLDVRTLPDLSVTSGSVVATPLLPRTGDTVAIDVTIANTGDQAAGQFVVELRDAQGLVLGASTVDGLGGGATATTAFTWIPSAVGEQTLQVVVNPSHAVAEVSWNNNEAGLSLFVQDNDLFLSSRYFSPDGDGVLDELTIYFRAAPQEILITDTTGTAVRAIPVAAGDQWVTWDGLTGNGFTADDGVYRVVADGLTTWVALDTNRSTLSAEVTGRVVTGTFDRLLAQGTTSEDSFRDAAALPSEAGWLLREAGTKPQPFDKIYRFVGEDRIEIGDTPGAAAGTGCSLQGATASGSRLHFRCSTSHILATYPGPTTRTVAFTGSGAMSPDGQWLLLFQRSDATLFLHSIDNPGEVYTFGPFKPAGTSVYAEHIVWSADSSRAVVSVRIGSSNSFLVELVVATPPSATKVVLTGYQSNSGVAELDSAISFAERKAVWYTGNDFHVFNLTTGSRLQQSLGAGPSDPCPESENLRVKLSHDGRAVASWANCRAGRGNFTNSPGPAQAWSPSQVVRLTNWEKGATRTLTGEFYGARWSAASGEILGDVASQTAVGWLATANNLRASLRPRVLFGNAGIALSVVAVDRYLDRYLIEYAPISTPNDFQPLGLARRDPIYGTLWGTWLPPAKGRYLLRLTAWDRSGHVQQTTKQVTWAGERDIANLWVESQYLSPRSSPGIKDNLTIQFTVLRPSNVLFEIRDAANVLVRQIPMAAPQIGPKVATWDGTDSTGNPVPDGDYTLSYLGATWPVTVDNTPPAISLTIAPTKKVTDEALTENLFINEISMSVSDQTLDEWRYETRDRLDPLVPWLEEQSDQAAVNARLTVGMEKPASEVFWLSATDLAGNSGEVQRTLVDPRLVFVDAEPSCRKAEDPAERCSYSNRPPIGEVEEGLGLLADSVMALHVDWDTLLVQQAVGAQWREGLRLEFRTPAEGALPPDAWQQGSIQVAPGTLDRRVDYKEDSTARVAWGELTALYWDHVGMVLRPLEVRLVATTAGGQTVTSDTVLFIPEAPLTIEYLGITEEGAIFRVRNVSSQPIATIRIQVEHWSEGWMTATWNSGTALAPNEHTDLRSGCDVMCWRSRYLPPNSGPWPLRVRAMGGQPGAVSFPTSFIPPQSWPEARTGFNSASCALGPSQPQGGRIFEPLPAEACGVDTPTGCGRSGTIASSGGLLPIHPGLPVEPTSAALVGYDLLLDGAVAFSAENPVTGGLPSIELNLASVQEGSHALTERFRYDAGAQGLLGACPRSWDLFVDRTPPQVQITSPEAGAQVCPQDGILTVEVGYSDNRPITELTRRLWLDDEEKAEGCDLKLDLREVTPGSHVLRVEATDAAGNSTCATTPIVVLDIPKVGAPDAQPRIFSPVNTTGAPQASTIAFRSNVPGSFEVTISSAAGEPKRIVTGDVALGDLVELAWDGTDALGAPVPDGAYQASIHLTSTCGAQDSAFIPELNGTPIVVDRTPPEVVVVHPTDNQQLGAVVEVVGRVRDTNLGHWAIEVRAVSACEDCYQEVAGGDQATGETPGVLAQVQTRHLPPEDHLLRLRAIDKAGNETSSGPITIVLKPRQVFDGFTLEPPLISPNDDGTLDVASATVFLAARSDVTATVRDQSDQVVRTLLEWTILDPDPTGTPIVWDGRDDAGEAVPDGRYSVQVDGELESDSSIAETEALGLEVDRTPPATALPGLIEGGLYGLPLPLRGTVLDTHPGDFTLSLVGPDGVSQTLASGIGEIENVDLAILSGIPDGIYTAVLTAHDAAGNTGSGSVTVQIDNSAPVALITAPGPDSSHNPDSGPWALRGSLRAAHPDHFEWAWAPGTDPQPGDFVALFAGSTIPDNGVSEVEWPTAGLPEGLYTLRLALADELERVSESRVVVTLDRTSPQVTLDTPLNGSVVWDPTPIRGQVQDVNLKQWRLDLAPSGGEFTDPPLAQGSSPVGGDLVDWRPLPPVGYYTLRLVGIDQAGNTSEATATVQVGDTRPGAPENVVATVVNRRDVVLTWQPGPGVPPAGYFVYRGTTRLNAVAVVDTTFTDAARPDGTFTYTVRAVAMSNYEGDPSLPATVTIDTVSPVALIALPLQGARVAGLLKVRGTAAKDRGFMESHLEVRAQGSEPFALIAQHTASVVGGLLGEWATGTVADGVYELRLSAVDVYGNSASHLITVEVDNTAPPAPTLTSAVLSAMDGDSLQNDVRVTWTLASPPSDLSGYYLYRNGVLANAPGPVVGSQRAFLLPGPSYDDKNLPDGTYIYHLTAADNVDNESPDSNPSLPITVDTRRPHAVITSPAGASQFEDSVEIVAETPDTDVVSLQFEFQRSGDPGWTPLGAPFSGPPYRTVFAPGALGTYLVRALAADATGPDPAPTSIAVTSADLPPQPPFGLAVQVDGDAVILTWSTSPSTDLAGYRVYRGTLLVTPDLVPAPLLTHTDLGVPEGTYSYTVKAVDQSGQEGVASQPVSATVYAPSFSFVPPVSSLSTVSLGGTSCTGTCELQRDTGSGYETIATASSFTFPNVPLDPGVNRFRAVATTSGSRSKPSSPLILVRHDLPATPSAFAASATADAVTLSWNSQVDPDNAGFQLRRDGVVINEPTTPLAFNPSTHTLAGSTGTLTNWAKAVDGDTATAWSLSASSGWIQWTWPSPIQVTSITSAWGTPSPYVVDLRVLVAGEWLWWDSRSCSGTGCPTTLSTQVAAVVQGLRIDFRSAFSSIALREITVQTTSRTPASPFVDSGVPSGSRRYEVFAANTWGQLSPGALAFALVNVTAPPPPASVSATPGPGCGEVTVSWEPPAPPPAWPSGYRVYRSLAGGPFALAGSTVPGVLTFVDTGLPTGSAVQYQVTTMAVDNGAEVESTPQATSPVTVTCSSPTAPEILTPGRSGEVYQTATMRLDVSGAAELGSTVRLLQDGQEIAAAVARRGVVHSTLRVQQCQGDISFDASGDMAVCRAWDSTASQYRVGLVDLASGTLTLLGTPGADVPAISPDGIWAVYRASVGGTQDLFLHHLADGAETRVTTDATRESSPVFLADSSGLIWVSASSVRRYAISSGSTATLFTFTPASSPRLVTSPDGTRLVATSSSGPQVFSFATGQIQSLPCSNVCSYSNHPFSPDGRQLVYVEYPGAGAQMWLRTFDLVTLAAGIPAISADSTAAVWTEPEALLIQRRLSTTSSALIRHDLATTQETTLATNSSTGSLWQTPLGECFWVISNEVVPVDPTAGGFRFANLALHPGRNDFVARQELPGVSLDSGPLHVDPFLDYFYDPKVVSFTAQPSAVSPAGETLIEAVVVSGNITTPACEVVLRRLGPDGIPEEVYRTSLYMPEDEAIAIRYSWTALSEPGQHLWAVVLDPDDEVVELDETNNSASTTVRVLADGDSSLAVTSDAPTYWVGGTVRPSVVFVANSAPQNWTLETFIEDELGHQVATIDSRGLPGFGPGTTEYSSSWTIPTSIYPGVYRVHVRATAPGAEAIHALCPFVVQAPTFVSTRVVADHVAITVGDTLNITGRVSNMGTAALPGVTVLLLVEPAAGGATTAYQLRTIDPLAGQAVVNLAWAWSTAGVEPGDYRVRGEVRNAQGGVVASSPPFLFTITPAQLIITAQMSVAPVQIEPGQGLTVSAAVTNPGSVMATVQVKASIVDPTGPSEVAAQTTDTSLAPGETRQLSWSFDTSGLALQPYGVLLRATGTAAGQQLDQLLASGGFVVTDLTPPVLQILDPQVALSCGRLVLRAQVTDPLTSVRKVFFRVDGIAQDLPMSLESINGTGDIYAATWTFLPDQDGPHTITVHAEDGKGNPVSSPPIQIEADSGPPALTHNAPEDGTCAAPPFTIRFEAADPHLASVVATLNGQPYASGTPIETNGAYQLIIDASDTCDQHTRVERHFQVGAGGASAEFQIDGAENGGLYWQAVDVTWTVTGIDPQAVTATLNGEPVGQQFHVTEPGTYTLHLTANVCGGVSEHEITFHVVDVAPQSGVPGSAGAVALIDGGTDAGADIERWLLARGAPVIRYKAPCQALRDLRGGQLSAVVLYLPPGARPISFAECLPGDDTTETSYLVCPSLKAPCQQAPWELSAATFRRSGLLVLGDLPPAIACFLPELQAPGALGGLDVYRLIEAVGTGAVVTPPAELELHTVRALQPAGAAAALLSPWPGQKTTPQCTGVRKVSLRLEPPFPIDGRTLKITASSPLVSLDHEQGVLEPEGGKLLDEHTGPWANLAVGRPGKALVADLVSVDGGPLPRWVEIAVETTEKALPTRFAEVVDIGCTARVDDTRHPVAILSLQWIAKAPEQIVLSTVRRYGRGQAAVAPFDVARSANVAAEPVVAQMLEFVMPDDPWPVLPGMPVPVEVRVDNRAPLDVPVRITADIDPALLIGGPGQPPPGDSPFYEEAVPAKEGRAHTFWVRMPEDGTPVAIPIHFEVNTAAGWYAFSEPTVTLTPECLPREAELGAVRSDLVRLRDLPRLPTAELLAAVNQTLPEIDSLVGLPPEPAELNCSMVVLRRAFARFAPFDLPEVEAARDRLARLLAMYARKQVEVTP